MANLDYYIGKVDSLQKCHEALTLAIVELSKHRGANEIDILWRDLATKRDAIDSRLEGAKRILAARLAQSQSDTRTAERPVRRARHD